MIDRCSNRREQAALCGGRRTCVSLRGWPKRFLYFLGSGQQRLGMLYRLAKWRVVPGVPTLCGSPGLLFRPVITERNGPFQENPLARCGGKGILMPEETMVRHADSLSLELLLGLALR